MDLMPRCTSTEWPGCDTSDINVCWGDGVSKTEKEKKEKRTRPGLRSRPIRTAIGKGKVRQGVSMRKQKVRCQNKTKGQVVNRQKTV